MNHPTFNQMLEMSPGLDCLYAKAKAVADDGGKSFCANAVWYGSLKPELLMLVGLRAKGAHESMRTMEAYQIAYHGVYTALPRCRACGCM